MARSILTTPANPIIGETVSVSIIDTVGEATPLIVVIDAAPICRLRTVPTDSLLSTEFVLTDSSFVPDVSGEYVVEALNETTTYSVAKYAGDYAGRKTTFDGYLFATASVGNEVVLNFSELGHSAQIVLVADDSSVTDAYIEGDENDLALRNAIQNTDVVAALATLEASTLDDAIPHLIQAVQELVTCFNGHLQNADIHQQSDTTKYVPPYVLNLPAAMSALSLISVRLDQHAQDENIHGSSDTSCQPTLAGSSNGIDQTLILLARVQTLYAAHIVNLFHGAGDFINTLTLDTWTLKPVINGLIVALENDTTVVSTGLNIGETRLAQVGFRRRG